MNRVTHLTRSVQLFTWHGISRKSINSILVLQNCRLPLVAHRYTRLEYLASAEPAPKPAGARTAGECLPSLSSLGSTRASFPEEHSMPIEEIQGEQARRSLLGEQARPGPCVQPAFGVITGNGRLRNTMYSEELGQCQRVPLRHRAQPERQIQCPRPGGFRPRARIRATAGSRMATAAGCCRSISWRRRSTGP